MNPQSNDVTNTQPLFRVNAELTNGTAPGYWPQAGSGLNLFITAGSSFDSGNFFDWVGGTLTLADNSTSYVFLDASNSCTPNVNFTGVGAGDVPIAVVTTAGGVITDIVDLRTFFIPQTQATGGGGGTASTLQFYDIGCTFDGSMLDSQIMTELPMVRPISFAPNMVPSQGYAKIVPASSATFSIRKNNVEFAQMTFGAGANVAIFTGSEMGFSIGDLLSVLAPSPIDSSLADIGYILSAMTAPNFDLSLRDSINNWIDVLVHGGGTVTIVHLSLSDSQTANWDDYIPAFTEDYGAMITDRLTMTDGSPVVTPGGAIHINIS